MSALSITQQKYTSKCKETGDAYSKELKQLADDRPVTACSPAATWQKKSCIQTPDA